MATLHDMKQVAEICECPIYIVDYATRNRYIKSRKIGAHWIFSKSNIEEMKEYLRNKKRLHANVSETKPLV